MSVLVLVGGLAALIGLWSVVCRLDFKTSAPRALAALLMIFGAVTLIGWAAGSPAIGQAWLANGMATLLFGLGTWLAFDRRSP